MWLPCLHGRRGFGRLLGAVVMAVGSGKAMAQQPAEKSDTISGTEKSDKSTVLEMGASILQTDSPISAINMYLNGFHFYADDMGRQIEAHHFCQPRISFSASSTTITRQTHG